MLDTKELDYFKKELESMKFKIEKNLYQNSYEMCTIESIEPKDEADYASLEKGQSITNQLMLNQAEKLKAIKRSLERIKNGTYGICDACGEEIQVARLKVKVFADYCISCREVIEREAK